MQRFDRPLDASITEGRVTASRQAIVQRELREVLARQIRDGDPPETAATFARLRAAGHAETEVWQLMSAALLMELDAIARDARPFDRAGYVAALHALPTIRRR